MKRLGGGKRFDHKVKVTKVCPAGIGHERLSHPDNELERLFRLAWQSCHAGRQYSGSTMGDLLAHLLNIRSYDPLFGSMTAVTERDRVVAATVFQWLGTRVGWGVLRSVLREHAEGERLVYAIENAYLHYHPRYARLAPGRKRIRRFIESR